MAAMTSQQLTVAGLFWAAALVALLDCIKAEGWRRVAFGVLAVVFALAGFLVKPLWNSFPDVSTGLTTVATHPVSWFVLTAVAYLGLRRSALPQVQKTSAMPQIEEAAIKPAAARLGGETAKPEPPQKPAPRPDMPMDELAKRIYAKKGPMPPRGAAWRTYMDEVSMEIMRGIVLNGLHMWADQGQYRFDPIPEKILKIAQLLHEDSSLNYLPPPDGAVRRHLTNLMLNREEVDNVWPPHERPISWLAV
ncbi:hypothetical protein [Sphingomonas sp.]|uniref:hypothetical protein n=1 Tax=Sphingomonas sp. TaxID=28214 RepID=UPI0038AB6947